MNPSDTAIHSCTFVKFICCEFRVYISGGEQRGEGNFFPRYFWWIQWTVEFLISHNMDDQVSVWNDFNWRAPDIYFA